MMPSNSYYDNLVSTLLSSLEGATPEDGREARRFASGQEDAMLRHELGYKYKKPKSDRRPEGAYSMADYPYLHYAIWAAKGGLPPAQMSGNVIPGSKKDLEMQEQRKRWAAAQEAMLYKDGFWNHYDW